jgi:hypothetical protein
MAHLSSVSAAMFTDLSVAVGVPALGIAQSPQPATLDAAGFAALFTTTSATALKYLQIGNIRSFPAVGAPANIVNVPVFGQRQSQTIGGQSDAPSLEITINYVPALWSKGATPTTWAANVVATAGSELANMVGDGQRRAWRMALLATQPTGATLGPTQSQYDSNAGGLGKVENSVVYWLGKLESLLITPSLTDATTATLAFSIQSDFYGPYTQ